MNDDISVKSKTLLDWVFEIISWGFCALIALAILLNIWPLLLIGLILYLASEYPEELWIFAFFVAIIFSVISCAYNVYHGGEEHEKRRTKSASGRDHGAHKTPSVAFTPDRAKITRSSTDKFSFQAEANLPLAAPSVFAGPPERYRFSKFDYQVAQAQLKSIGLYVGPIDGVWGPRSQKALADLKDLKKWLGDAWVYDDERLISVLVKTGEEQLADAYALENELATASELNGIFLPKAEVETIPRMSMPAYGYSGVTHVDGYFRANGTYVEPHFRTQANRTKADNWSTKGNVNPFTGKRGSKR